MKSLKITIILLIVSQVINAQITFNRIIEDTVSHITSGVITVDTGYVLLTGSQNEFMVRTFALTYIGLTGNPQWKLTYTDSENELWEGFNNLKNEDALPYIAGAHHNTTTGERSIYLQKFNNQFEQDFQVFINTDMTWKQALDQIHTDSYFYIVGQIYDESISNYKLLLIKTDNLGNSIWSKSIGSLYESGGHIIRNSENNLIIGGITGSFSLPLHNSMWYILKSDTSGNVIWEKAFGHNSLNNGAINCLIETQDSNILACGSSPVAKYGSGDGVYIWDGCLRKIDQYGDLLWERLYRNYSKIESPDMIHLECSLNSIIYKDNDLYLLGNNRDHRGASRGYLQKINDLGDICWQRNYYAIDTNSTYQWLVSIKNTIDNGFVLAGYGNNYNTHGYDPPQQAWLVKTDSLGMDGLCNVEADELNIDIDIPQIPESICMNDTIEVYVYIAGKSAPYTIEFSTGQVIDSVYYPSCFVPV